MFCVPQVATFALLALQLLAEECIDAKEGHTGHAGHTGLTGDHSFLVELVSELGDESRGALGARGDENFTNHELDENEMLIRTLVCMP